jgi:polysaccharide export outer membrane protein
VFLHTTRRISGFPPISLLVISFLVSCVSNPPSREENIFPELLSKEIEKSRQIKAMNDKILMSTLSSRREHYGDYIIGSEDLLEISVFEVEELNKTVRVSSQGSISLPLLGTLKAKGLTVNELEREIRDTLAEKYLQDPQVTVFIKEYRSYRISVIGAVNEPNLYDVAGQKTILDMLAMAEGLRDDAGYLLFVNRPPGLEEEAAKAGKYPEQESPRTFVVDLEELLVKGNFALNLPLMNGDVINVPVSGKVFVGGEVMKPGGFPLRGEKMTVSQAVILAGGVKPEADGSRTKIFRYSDKGTAKEILSVDVYAIQKGEEEDPYLKENDIIIVPRHGVKGFLVEFRETFRSIFSVGYALGL